MKSVAVVGLGWLGLPMARLLQHAGWDVKGSKRTHEGVEQMRLLRLETYHLELTPEINADPDDLAVLFDVDALVINIPPSQYFFDARQYKAGVENVVKEALLHNINHLIFISSTSVFAQVSGRFDEKSIPVPQGETAKALYETEQWLQQLADIDCDILRLGGLIGQDRHPIHSLAGKTDISLGNQPVNLVHIDDVIRAVEVLLETPSGKRLYHLVAAEHPIRADYYTRTAEKLGVNPPHFICSPQDPQRVILGDKIAQELDFVYQYPDPDSMLPTIK
ncbi:nucleoside-diphosphate-sugar epimerase [Cricetibacter osteomyelitidis]|uniref:Nucleoside-diphosphate-sugar epimerase n=1 Tax=Cricetibacter osteomyelitidis TaxID=1521931 RepID=A0A4V6NS91_9PAST|nr:NAD(P)-binding domain-containing protein [Cricetibacter osteomyelitidis]TCP96483.1 nucleoside-diphosphate-sugar epimerase [Cricetibacter osteomyelitidis]